MKNKKHRDRKPIGVTLEPDEIAYVDSLKETPTEARSRVVSRIIRRDMETHREIGTDKRPHSPSAPSRRGVAGGRIELPKTRRSA